MVGFGWTECGKLAEKQRREISTEAADPLARLEQAVEGQSALFSMLGHKGDLMFIHFRNSFEQLKAVELQISQLRISDFLDASTSYLSMVEMGLYESSVKLFRQLQERGLEPNTPELNAEIEET